MVALVTRQRCFPVLIGIAVEATEGAGVVHADVPAGKAATSLAGGLDLSDLWAIGEELGQQITINAMSLLHVPSQEGFLTAGVECHPACLCDLDHGAHEFELRRKRGFVEKDAGPLQRSLYFAVKGGETEIAAFCGTAERRGDTAKTLQAEIRPPFIGEENRIEAPEYLSWAGVVRYSRKMRTESCQFGVCGSKVRGAPVMV